LSTARLEHGQQINGGGHTAVPAGVGIEVGHRIHDRQDGMP
jgi:hypothetical protein